MSDVSGPHAEVRPPHGGQRLAAQRAGAAGVGPEPQVEDLAGGVSAARDAVGAADDGRPDPVGRAGADRADGVVHDQRLAGRPIFAGSSRRRSSKSSGQSAPARLKHAASTSAADAPAAASAAATAAPIAPIAAPTETGVVEVGVARPAGAQDRAVAVGDEGDRLGVAAVGSEEQLRHGLDG